MGVEVDSARQEKHGNVRSITSFRSSIWALEDGATGSLNVFVAPSA